MNTWIKNIFLVAGGILFSLLLLFIYSQFTTASDKEDLNFINPDVEGVFISAFSGEVFILRGAETFAAQVGQALLEGDILKVVEDAYCQVQFAQHGTATLNSNTLLRIQRFLNASKDQDIQTEILMGSMLYRVNKNESDRKFQVESAGTNYEITGTEFLIERSSEGTRLSVLEGSVMVSSLQKLWKSLQTQEGEEIYIPLEGAPEAPGGISNSNRAKIEELQGLADIVVSNDQEMLMIAIESDPQGGDIYLNGRKVGTSYFQGLFMPGEVLSFRVRKRGFHDGLLTLETQEGENRRYRIELLPSPLSETLEEGLQPRENPEQEIEQKYQSQLDQYQEELQKRMQELEEQREELSSQQRSLNSLMDQLDSLKNKESSMEQQLKVRDEEIGKLKSLIQQIQELTD